MTKHQRTVDDAMSAAGMMSKKMEGKKEDQSMETDVVTEPVALHELSLLIVKAMRNMGEETYPTWPFHNVYL